MSDEVVCDTVYRHCLTLHTAVERQKSNSSLCMPTYTKTKIWIFQQCDMWVRTCKHWYGCLYILNLHVWTMVTYSLRTTVISVFGWDKLYIAQIVIW